MSGKNATFDVDERLKRAERTLIAAGYIDQGGQYWRPPVGSAPPFETVDALRYLAKSSIEITDEARAHLEDAARMLVAPGRRVDTGLAYAGKSADRAGLAAELQKWVNRLGAIHNAPVVDLMERAIEALSRSTDAPSEPVAWQSRYHHSTGSVEMWTDIPKRCFDIYQSYPGGHGESMPEGAWIESRALGVIATPPAATPDDVGRGLMEGSVPWPFDTQAPATSTPCASGEGELPELPPLPEPVEFTAVDYTKSVLYAGSGYTDDHMHEYATAYARSALAATQAPAVPAAEPVTCQRCGHENWIMEGKARAQIVDADKPAKE